MQVEEEKVSAQKAYVKKTKKIAKKPIDLNKYCFECKSPDPKFVSVNNGIYICIQCAVIHRDFGNTKVSSVRSLEMDILTSEQQKTLELGGNNNF